METRVTRTVKHRSKISAALPYYHRYYRQLAKTDVLLSNICAAAYLPELPLPYTVTPGNHQSGMTDICDVRRPEQRPQ